jgi:hypothetical protein
VNRAEHEQNMNDKALQALLPLSRRQRKSPAERFTEMEYEFEEAPITILGKRVAFVDGVAHFEKDGPMFWVRRVILDTADGTLEISRYSRDAWAREVCEQVHEFLYTDRHVAEAWAAHCESERADAA